LRDAHSVAGFVPPPDVSRGPRLAALRFSGAQPAEKHGVLGALLLFEPGR